MATDKSWKESWQFGRADDGPPLSPKQFLLRFSTEDAEWLEATFPPDPGTGIAAGEAYTMQRGPAAGHPVIAAQDIPARRSQATAWIRSVVSAAIAQAKADGFAVPAPPINEGREREQLLEKAHSEGLKASELARLLERPQSAINYARDNDQLASFGIKGDRGESIACVGWEYRDGRYYPLTSDRAPRTPPELPKPSEEKTLLDQAYSQGLTGAELAKLLGRSRGSITHARNRGQLLTLGKRPANGYKARQLVGWRESGGRYYPTFSLP